MRKLAAALPLLAALSGCASLGKLEIGGYGIPGTGGGGMKSVDLGRVTKGVNAIRKSAAEISESEEYYIGRAVSAQILGKYRASANSALNRYAQTVMQAVAAASDRPSTFKGYHVQVLDSDEVNAFAAPGGFIFVTDGLLRRVRSEDELAGVLAHEVAHVAGKHGLKAIKTARLTEAFTILGGEALKSSNEQLGKLSGLFGGAVDDVVGQLIQSGYSVDKEYEADRLGAQYARAAGYDPGALRSFIETLEKEPARGGLFKTHPPAAKRVAKLGSVAPAPGYKRSAARNERFKAALPQGF